MGLGSLQAKEMTENLQEQTGQIEAEAEVKTAGTNESEIVSYLDDCAELYKSCKHYEGTPNISTRCFYMNDGRVFFGIVIFDTTDSFLVGATARMVFSEGEIKPDSIFPVNVVRLFKSNIQAVTKPLELVKYHYYKYLQDKGQSLLPGFLTEAKMKGISDFIEEYSNSSRDKENSVMSSLNARANQEGPLGVAVSPGSMTAVPAAGPSLYEMMKEMIDNREIQGASEFAFMPLHISEKIQ